MRIAFLNSNRRREGDVETYIDTTISALHEAGHEIALCHEIDRPLDRASIRLPQGVLSWCASDLGVQRTVAAVREWRPDVIYSHSFASVELERQIMDVAPAVLFAHVYRGICISGSKTFTLPAPHPCHRRFGWPCFLHFYPRRCGGLNPVTMQSLYRVQANRLALIQQYKVILTSSDHMRSEYIRQGIPADRVIPVHYGVTPLRPNNSEGTTRLTDRTSSRIERRLVFAGRMDSLKGGSLLLNLMPLLRSRLGRPIRLTLAGDGPHRLEWETVASHVRRSGTDVNIEFTGRLEEERLASLFDTSDLFVMPSLWPEPFGIVGVQAGLQGLPSAAFNVGGIPTWLIDGLSGHLAPGDPPIAEGLADAIVKCLSNREHHLDLRKGAVAVARRFTVENHMRNLLEILEGTASGDIDTLFAVHNYHQF